MYIYQSFTIVKNILRVTRIWLWRGVNNFPVLIYQISFSCLYDIKIHRCKQRSEFNGATL